MKMTKKLKGLVAGIMLAGVLAGTVPTYGFNTSQALGRRVLTVFDGPETKFDDGLQMLRHELVLYVYGPQGPRPIDACINGAIQAAKRLDVAAAQNQITSCFGSAVKVEIRNETHWVKKDLGSIFDGWESPF